MPDRDLSQYALVIAPMLYMVRKALAERAGGICGEGRPSGDHYWSGIADEMPTSSTGGFPARPATCWASGQRSTARNEGERNPVQGLAGNASGLQGPYQVRHLWRADPRRIRPDAGGLPDVISMPAARR